MDGWGFIKNFKAQGKAKHIGFSFQPLTEQEQATIRQAVEIINSLPTIPCTACRYCVDGCPMSINIPGIFKAVNSQIIYNDPELAKREYARATEEGGKASDCIQCGKCEKICPQHLEIRALLRDVAKEFEK